MAKASQYKANFSSGQLSPLLAGRSDTSAYQNGAELLSNAIVLPQGPIQNRPGEEFIAHAYAHATQSRLISFVFSTIQAYTIEIADQFMRFYRDQAPIVEASVVISGITAANPGVVTATSHGYLDGEHVIIADGGGVLELNLRRVIIANKTTHTFELTDMHGNNIDTSAMTAYSSGGSCNRVYTIASPYLEAELSQIQFTQSADVMYLAHPSHKPRKLTRTGHTSWTISNYAPTADPFTSTDNYPSCISIYEQRIVFAATNNDPQKLFSTVSGDYEDMTVGTADNAAWTYTIGSNQVNGIKWLFPETFLLAGTDNGTFTVRGSSFNDAITPSNIKITRDLRTGATAELPELVKDVVMFIQRLGRRIFGANYSGGSDKYTDSEATIKSRGITDPSVTQLSFQEDPNNILWMARGDGKLVGLTAEFTEEVIAWHEHELGGTDVVLESICVTPSTSGDEVWMCVRRTVNGQTVRFIGLLKIREENTLADAFYVDSGLTYSGAATNVLTGLDHLEGETVTILADGATHPTKVVSGGQITLERTTTKAHVGLGYISKMHGLDIEGGTKLGASQGKKKKISRVRVKFNKTVGARVGTSPTKIETVPWRKPSDPMDAPPILFTGTKKIDPDSGFKDEAKVYIEQHLPMPWTVVGYEVDYEVVE